MSSSTVPPIYLDHHATTPVDDRVLAHMLPFFGVRFGNAASKGHPYGWDADEAVAGARRDVAALIGAEPREVVFTSGATESINLALKGAVAAALGTRRDVVTWRTEHKATLDTARRLEKRGTKTTVLDVNPDGTFDLNALDAAITDDTLLVSVMHCNNEVGTVHDISAIGALCRRRGVLLHVDAAQSASTLPIDVTSSNIDLLSLSAHKMYGPKGVGALFIRRKTKIHAEIDGGGHERGHRSGTLNVPGVVGLGHAAQLAKSDGPDDRVRMAGLRDLFLAEMTQRFPDLVVHGTMSARHPGNLSFAIPFVEAEPLLLKTCRRVALSTGSACTQANLEPSHVLRALRVPNDLAHCSLRLGLGRQTTRDDVLTAVDVIAGAATALRDTSVVAAVADTPSI